MECIRDGKSEFQINSCVCICAWLFLYICYFSPNYISIYKNWYWILVLECYIYFSLSIYLSFDLYLNILNMIALIFLLVLLLLFPLFFPGYYVSELLISFLPYIAAISGFFVIVAFVYFKKYMKPWNRFSVYRYFRGISFLVLCSLFFWYSKQFNNFYIQKPFIQKTLQNNLSNTNSWDLTVLFANIHKDNISYEKIKRVISDNNPDMLMFVEFADHHYDNLKDFLQSKYPYTNSTTRSKKFVGSMVFSKYPLTNKADDFPQWMRRYGYFSLPYNNHEIYFYLVHTSSPDSYSHFVMRNEQLTTFVKDFKNHESNRNHPDIVAVWDFNITPRSSYYSIFSTAFSGELFNMTKRLPFLFTRKLKILPIFLAHIDHLWTSPSLDVQDLKTITIPGSDHKAFLFTLHF